MTAPQPGDLVFFTGSPMDPPPGHVALYIGGGQMIQAYATGIPIRVTARAGRALGLRRPGGAS